MVWSIGIEVARSEVEPAGAVIRFKRHRSFVEGDGGLIIFRFLDGEGAVPPDFVVIGVELFCFIEDAESVLVLVEVHVGVGEVDVGGGVFLFQEDAFLEVLDGLLGVAALGFDDAEVVVGAVEAGGAGLIDEGLEGFLGLVEVIHLEQGDPEVIAGVVEVGVDFAGFGVGFGGFGEVLLSGPEQAEVIGGLVVTGVFGEGGLEGLLGFGEVFRTEVGDTEVVLVGGVIGGGGGEFFECLDGFRPAFLVHEVTGGLIFGGGVIGGVFGCAGITDGGVLRFLRAAAIKQQGYWQEKSQEEGFRLSHE
ncbi:MAG: hypothetical protein RI897_2171 [Verrucomicrobiota bacterium]